ncbi:major facilitator superfamily transporter [Dactylonectria macrodidyma]|uniref:Major facilitator superfamily transporter n=1 Tax=Dactylonectria macrodidyma TaxID=307937 RepID=A0A9P9IST1_9HYPO|nr:major facilitator superfamily transporter [Dactylonectria macrodidyma]
MAVKEPLASSADSQMTGITLQTAGQEQDNNGGFTDKESVTEQPDEEAAAPAGGYKSDAPDGGLKAWLVVLGAWCTSFCSFGWLNSVGVFQEYYQNNLLSDYSASTISWIPSLQIFFMMAMGPIIGTIYDRYGPRQLLLAGTFLHVFGIMMTSLGTQYWQIMLAQGVCSALGVSAIFQPALNTIHGWFSTNTGAAFGILATGSSLGGVIFPIMVTRLIKQVGFGWAMRTCGFLLLALLVVANLTVRAFHKPSPKKVTGAQLARPFREPEFVLLNIGFFLFTYGIYVPINYLPVQALATGMDVDLIEYLVPILNAASLFGRIFSGVMGDRIGRYNIFIAVGYLTALWTLALWIPVSTAGGIIAFAALFGFCSGAYVSLIAPLIAQISPIEEIGFRTGLTFCVSAIGGLTTNPINGAILDGPGGLTGIKIFAGCFCFAGTVFIMAARVHRIGWSLKAKF